MSSLRWIGVFLLLVAVLSAGIATGTSAAMARDVVTVGGYAFPPYVELASDGGATGLTPEVIQELNRVQERYEFRFVLTTPTRRYQDFQAGRFDAILFEMPEWGWRAHGVAVDVSEQIATDGEVYVAATAPGRDEGYFDTLATRRIAAILGYNYGFTGYRNDPTELRRRFDIALVNDHAATIELVVRGRVDIGVVTESYLGRHLSEHPAERDRLLISQRRDQVYSLRVLARPGMAPSADDIAGMLEAAGRAGRLGALWARHGLVR